MRKALSVVLSVALGVFIPFMNYDFVNANNYKDSALEVKLINEKSRRSTILKK